MDRQGEANVKKVTRRGFFQSAGVAAAVPVFATIGAGAPQSAPVLKVDSDIVYGKGGDMDLHLDIYHPPAGTEKKMAVIHIHGGGFTGGSKTGVASSSRAFAGLGYVSIASQYRLAAQGKWPAQIEDVKAAIRWTRANASQLGIDADKIAIAGYSAGGLMALFAAGTNDRKEFEGSGGNAGVSSKVAACCSFYAATGATQNIMPDGSDRAALQAASAASVISPSFAPTIFFHGLGDVTIRPDSTLDFFSKLRAAGVKVDLHLFQGAPHAYETNNPDAALVSAQLANLFFDRLILNPKEYPPFGAGGRGGAGGGARGAGAGGRGGERGQ
jgi:acetyl esterase/lipase